MPGHAIVCGMGDVGYRIVELLHRLGEEVVVVTQEAREERLAEALHRGIRVLRGDARNDRLLLEAGLATAGRVIAATDQDLVNIEISLDARRYRPDVEIVLRLFDPELAQQLEQTLEVRRALGMASLAAPSFAAAALGDAFLASFTSAGAPFVVGRSPLAESTDAPFPGAPDIPDIETLERRHGLQTLLIERADGGCEALPGPDVRLLPGDRVTLVGHKDDWDRLLGPAAGPAPRRAMPARPSWPRRSWRAVRRALTAWKEEPPLLRLVFLGLCLLIPASVLLFHYYLRLSVIDAVFYTVRNLHGEIGLATDLPEIRLYEILLTVLGSVTVATLYSMITDYLVTSRLKKILGGRPMPRNGHVIVVGMGRVGYRILRELHSVGVPVAAIEMNPGAALIANVRTIAPVITGDARSDEILAQAGLAQARAVVAATADDSVNLSIALAARRLNSGARTAVRLFDAVFARKVESALQIDAALSASRIAAPTFVASALYPDVAKAVIVKDRLFVLIERQAGDWAGRTPAELRAEQGLRLLRRGGALSPTAGETPLAAKEETLSVLCRTLAPSWSEAQASLLPGPPSDSTVQRRHA
ncbi:MAG TPA: NAD-binding protein [Thermoanaerobaculia bacterium]|nr:NAD-binding protein [Thermoanaerobaculia bacterium]